MTTVNDTVPSIPSPSGIDRNSERLFSPIRETLDIWAGRVGDPLDRVVTFRDLLDESVVVYAGGGGGGGVTSHGALTGLLVDDHTQYLLVDGTRAMGGNLDLEGNCLVLDVDGDTQICAAVDDVMTFNTGGNQLAKFRDDSGSLHIGEQTFDTTTLSANGRKLVIANTTSFAYDGMTFVAANNGSSFIYFADPDDSDIGYIRYDHDANVFNFQTNNTVALVLDSTQSARIANNLRIDGNLYFGATGQQVGEIVTAISGASTDSQLATAAAIYTEVTGAITAHEGAADPHTGYQLESEKGSANGYAGLDASAYVPTANLGSGTANNTTYLRGDQTWQTIAAGGAFTLDGNENLYAGTGALASLTSGTDNFAAGENAATAVTTADGVVAIGEYAGASWTDANDDGCIAIGYQAGRYAAGGNKNLFIGSQAGLGDIASSSGTSNIAIGNVALSSFTTTSNTVVIGHNAAQNVVGSITSVYIGNSAFGLHSGASEDSNTMVGYSSGYGVAGTHNADYNCCLGAYTQTSNIDIQNGVAIGYQADQYNRSGNSNVMIGYQAGRGTNDTNDPAQCVCIGYQAGRNLTASFNNVLIGYYAGLNQTNKTATTAVGQQSMRYNNGTQNTGVGSTAIQGLSTGGTNSASYNAALGYGPLQNIDTGNYNVAMGFQAGYYQRDSDYGIYIGYHAGYGSNVGTWTGTDHNIGIGFEALNDLDQGDNNVAMGRSAMANMVGGNGNVAIGPFAYQDKTSENYGIAIGYNAGRFATNGASNIYMGFGSGAGPSSGGTFGTDYNVAIGYQAGGDNDTGSTNIYMGYFAGRYQSDGDNNIFMGQNAGAGPLSGGTYTGTDYNVGIGYYALSQIDTGDNNVAIGRLVYENISDDSNNVGIGYQCGENRTASNGNVFIGYAVGRGPLSGGTYTGNFNTCLGYNCAVLFDTSQQNVAMGTLAGYYQEDCDFNVFLGYHAGQGPTTGTYTATDFNTAVGALTLEDLDTGQFNTALGYEAGLNVSTGDRNTLLGSRAGDNITTGSENVVIGDVQVASATGSHQFNLGNTTYEFLRGDMSTHQLAIYGSSGYLNFNTTLGSTGYGIRDNAGAMEYKDSTGSWTAFNTLSDVTLKKNISSYTVGMELIDQLYPVQFQWKDEEKGTDYHCGLIAQDVKHSLNNLRVEWSGWNERGDGIQSVDYKMLVIPLINAVKQLRRELDELKRKM